MLGVMDIFFCVVGYLDCTLPYKDCYSISDANKQRLGILHVDHAIVLGVNGRLAVLLGICIAPYLIRVSYSRNNAKEQE